MVDVKYSVKSNVKSGWMKSTFLCWLWLYENTDALFFPENSYRTGLIVAYNTHDSVVRNSSDFLCVTHNRTFRFQQTLIKRKKPTTMNSSGKYNNSMSVDDCSQ